MQLSEHDGQGEQTPSQSRASVPSLTAKLTGQGFLACFLGLAATRVWLQCNFFSSYTQSDDGLITIVTNFAYGLTMLVGAAIALRRPFTPRGQNAVAWLSFAVMTISTLLIITAKDMGSPSFVFFACILAGIGGALGGGMWTVAYVRLGLKQSVLYAFLSLALGSAGGLAIGFLPDLLPYITSLFMPVIALLCFQRAMKVDVGRQRKTDAPYDKEPRSTILFILGGIAIFGFVLGISRGFPAGEPVPMDTVQRIVHQMGVVVISLFIIWWSVVRGKRLSFAFLWRIEIMLVALGMLLLSVFPGHFTALAIAIVNIADTLMLGVLWITMQDVSRHTSVHPYTVYGFAWAARVLSRNIGRLFIMFIGSTSATLTAIVGIVVFALAASMALLLSDGIPRRRALFSEDKGPLPATATVKLGATEDAGNAALATERPMAAATEDRTRAVAPALASIDVFAQLQESFALSERETEIARLIAQGRSKGYIAQELYVTENTVRTHTKNLYVKLGIHSKQDLIDIIQEYESEA